MAEFDLAIERILREEGGFVDDPDDSGGATNYGVSLRWLESHPDIGDLDHDGDVDADDIRGMTQEDAVRIYFEYWWQKFRYGEIEDQRVANTLFSFSVNMGPRQAHKLIQDALLVCGEVLAVDGDLGPISRTSIKNVSQDMLLGALRSRAACFYRHLAYRKPRLEKYVAGWLKRAYA